MKKILFSVFFITILLNPASACIPRDWYFSLNLIGLNVDLEKLESVCSSETCFLTENLIVIKSHYDGRVALMFEKNPIFNTTLTIRLPYDIEEDTPKISSINPEKYDWKYSVKTDLNFLKKFGILSVSEKEIEKISSLATNGKNIMLCEGEWKLLEANCFCEDGREVCLRCFKEIYNISLPKKVIEQKKDYSFYIFMVLLVIFLFLLSRTFIPANIKNFKMSYSASKTEGK